MLDASLVAVVVADRSSFYKCPNSPKPSIVLASGYEDTTHKQ